MNLGRPLAQADRDHLDDRGLADHDDRIGAGPHAQHAEALMPT